MYIPTADSFCAGAGLMDLGFLNAGVNVQSSLEIDPKCCKTLRKNFNHKVIEADICTQTVLDKAESDMYIFTYPCTKYSELADLHYTRTGDEIYLHCLRHLALRRPEMYVLENVPGMKKFPVVMEAMSKLPDYYINIFCPLDASNWLPQSRERLIIIGTKKPFNISPPEQSIHKVRLMDIIDEVPDMKIGHAVMQRINGVYRDKPIITDPNDPNAHAPTCLAHYSKDRGTRLVIDRSHPLGMRPYTVREFARLQGVPDWFEFAGSENDAMRQIGNGVAIPVAEWIGKQAIKYFN